MMYASDNNMTLPQSTHQKSTGGKSWPTSLQPYASGTITFKCPDEPDKKRTFTYVLNDFLTPKPAGAPPDLNYSILAKIDRPEETLMFAEASAHLSEFRSFPLRRILRPEDSSGRLRRVRSASSLPREKANYLFADGHVETLSWTEVQGLLRKDGTRFLNPSGK